MGVEDKQGVGGSFNLDSYRQQVERADKKRDEKITLNGEMWIKAQDLISVATSEDTSPEGLQAYIDNTFSHDPKVNDEISKTRSLLETGKIKPVQAYTRIVWAQIRSELAQREAEIDKK